MHLILTPAGALGLMLLSMICWGSWANSYKLTHGVRFEVFYWDFSLGLLLAAVVLALLIEPGTAGGGRAPFDMLTGAPESTAAAAAAGIVFNAANLLLVAAIAMTGLAVAFPVAIGTALVAGTALTYAVDRKGLLPYIVLGTAVALLAVFSCAVAYRRAAPTAAVTRKGIILCVVSGILMALWSPLAARSMRGPTALTPMASFLAFALAAFVSTFPFNLYLMRRPLIGSPVGLDDYRNLTWRAHLLGIVGGAVWSLGTASNLIAGNAVGFAASYAIGQSAPLVASLWGILAWREFAAAGRRVVAPLAAMFGCYALAIYILSRAF
jgi:glucose uptake protein